MTASRRRDEVLRGQLTGFTRLLHRLGQGDVRAVHSTRVASRRLRELLPILGADAKQHHIKRDLRKVTRTLGRIRELDVLADLLDDLRVKTPGAGRALSSTLEEIQAARKDAHAKAFKKGLERNVRRVVRRLKKISASLEKDAKDAKGGKARDLQDAPEPKAAKDAQEAWLHALDVRVARRAIMLRRGIVHAGAVYLPERLHEVRKATKKLRYAVELASQAVTRPEGSVIRTLKRNQDILGRLHDRQVGIDHIRELQASAAPDGDEAVGELNGVLTRLENDSRRLHGQYVRGRDELLAACDQLSKRSPAAVLRAHGGARLAHAG